MKWILIAVTAFLLGFGLGVYRVTLRSSLKAQIPEAPWQKQLYHCPMHPEIIKDSPGKCPKCAMDLVPVKTNETSTVKISPAVIQNIGVKTEIVQKKKLTREIRTTGIIRADETRQFIVTSRADGWIEKLNVNYTGQKTAKGDSLLELYSPELITFEEEYLQTLKDLESGDGEIKSRAEHLLSKMRSKLLYLNIPEEIRKRLETEKQVIRSIPLLSPYEGVITEKMAVEGQKIEAGMPLFRIADLSSVWIIASVYQEDIPFIKTGQKAEIELSYLSSDPYQGKITFISPLLDPVSKTAQVRIEVPNTESLDLKIDMFANVKILSPVSLESLTVPDQAVIRSGKRNIVVLDKGGGLFEPVEVKTGLTVNEDIQILSGLRQGDRIVTSSHFLIDSESNLKAVIRQMSGESSSDSHPSSGE